MQLNKNTNNNYTPRQLKLPLEIEKLINISDPVYTFCDVMDHIDLTPYFVEEKGYKTGRPRCDAEKLLKVILFAFMEHGISSLRDIEKLCRNDIRYIYLLDDMKAPSFATFGNFIRNELTSSIEQIFNDINEYIFAVEQVDLEHTYIDGTKIEANANKYTFVWKKAITKNQAKLLIKLADFVAECEKLYDIKVVYRDCVKMKHVKKLRKKLYELKQKENVVFVYGIGKRKTPLQKSIETLEDYLSRLKTYNQALHIGVERNSDSKTDHDATFMRMKQDALGNGQLKPAYNLQHGVDSEYVTWLTIGPQPTDTATLIPFLKEAEGYTAFEIKDTDTAKSFKNEGGFADWLRLQSWDDTLIDSIEEYFGKLTTPNKVEVKLTKYYIPMGSSRKASTLTNLV